MLNVTQIFVLATASIMAIASLLGFPYLFTIILVRRFHTASNILTANVCFINILGGGCFYGTLYVIEAFFPTLLLGPTVLHVFSSYAEIVVNCFSIYSIVVVTINRFVAIKYQNKRFFKRLTWSIISSIIQWIISIILPLPLLFFCYERCTHTINAPFWMRFYNFLCLIIFPSILMIIFNGLIYWTVTSSSRRIHAISKNQNSGVGAGARPNQTNARDIFLLKHILLIFLVFIVGWAPVYTLELFETTVQAPVWLLKTIQVPPVLTTIIIVADLLSYNHEVGQYLKEKILRIFH